MAQGASGGACSCRPTAWATRSIRASQVIDVFDVASMEVRALVNEQDRANVDVGQTMNVTSKIAPDSPLMAKVVSVSGQGRQDRMSGPLRQFEVTLKLEKPSPALLPGTSVELTAAGRKVDNVLVLPRQTVFEREGRPTVYEKTGDRIRGTPGEGAPSHREPRGDRGPLGGRRDCPD